MTEKEDIFTCNCKKVCKRKAKFIEMLEREKSKAIEEKIYHGINSWNGNYWKSAELSYGVAIAIAKEIL